MLLLLRRRWWHIGRVGPRPVRVAGRRVADGRVGGDVRRAATGSDEQRHAPHCTCRGSPIRTNGAPIDARIAVGPQCKPIGSTAPVGGDATAACGTDDGSPTIPSMTPWRGATDHGAVRNDHRRAVPLRTAAATTYATPMRHSDRDCAWIAVPTPRLPYAVAGRGPRVVGTSAARSRDVLYCPVFGQRMRDLAWRIRHRMVPSTANLCIRSLTRRLWARDLQHTRAVGVGDVCSARRCDGRRGALEECPPAIVQRPTRIPCGPRAGRTEPTNPPRTPPHALIARTKKGLWRSRGAAMDSGEPILYDRARVTASSAIRQRQRGVGHCHGDSYRGVRAPGSAKSNILFVAYVGLDGCAAYRPHSELPACRATGTIHGDHSARCRSQCVRDWARGKFALPACVRRCTPYGKHHPNAVGDAAHARSRRRTDSHVGGAAMHATPPTASSSRPR